MGFRQVLSMLVLIFVVTDFPVSAHGSGKQGKIYLDGPPCGTVFSCHAEEKPELEVETLKSPPKTKPPVRDKIGNQCSHCSGGIAEFLRPGFTQEELYEAIDQFILSTVHEFQTEYPHLGVVFHGSYGLYTRAADEYGELNAVAWREKTELPRHGDIDVVVETTSIANQLANYLLVRFKEDTFQHVSTVNFDIKQLLTSQPGQKVDGRPVTGFNIWFTARGCRHPKLHHIYKFDISVREEIQSSAVTVKYPKKREESYTFQVGTWDQFFEELGRDQRDEGRKSGRRLRELKKFELNKYGHNSGRTEIIQSLLAEKFPQVQEVEEEYCLLPHESKNHRMRENQEDALGGYDSWPEFEDEPPFTKMKRESRERGHKRQNRRWAEKKQGVSAYIENLFKVMTQLDEESAFRASIQAAVALKQRLVEHKAKRRDLENFYQKISKAYPEAGWLPVIKDLLFDIYNVKTRKESCPSIIFLAKHFCFQSSAENFWVHGDYVSISGKNIYLRPSHIRAFPEPVKSALEQLSQDVTGSNHHAQRYGQMLFMAQTFLERVRWKKNPVMIVPAWDQKAAVWVNTNCYCERDDMGTLVRKLPGNNKTDIVVLQKDGTWSEGIWPDGNQGESEAILYQDRDEIYKGIESSHENVITDLVPAPEREFDFPALQAVSFPTPSIYAKRTSNSFPSRPGSSRLEEFDRMVPVYKLWLESHFTQTSALAIYSSITRSLLHKPETKTFKKHLKSRKKQFDLTTEDAANWLGILQPFIMANMINQKVNPELIPPKGWMLAGSENAFLPLLLTKPSEVSAFPVDIFYLLHDQARSYRDALYLLAFVMEEMKAVQLIGRDSELSYKQLTLTPQENGINIISLNYSKPSESSMALWITSKGYTQVTYSGAAIREEATIIKKALGSSNKATSLQSVNELSGIVSQLSIENSENEEDAGSNSSEYHSCKEYLSD